MSGKSTWTATSVHHATGNNFGSKLEASDAFKVLGDLTSSSSWYNLRTLATATRMISEVKSCKRLIVPVDMRTIEDSGGQYIRLLMTIPLEMRSKLFIELETRGGPICDSWVAFAKTIQEEAGMSIVAWARCGSPEYLHELMEVLSPSILAIDGSCLKAAIAMGDRSFYIDAVECGLSGGARVMAAGVDTEEELHSMAEVGVELVCGALKSQTVEVQEGKFEPKAGDMALYDWREGRGQRAPA